MISSINIYPKTHVIGNKFKKFKDGVKRELQIESSGVKWPTLGSTSVLYLLSHDIHLKFAKVVKKDK